jgi:methylenetetrahydrofolate reductase (NADPH)
MLVADEYIQRMDAAVKDISKDDKKARAAAWRAEGIKMCIEQVQEMREIEGVAGVHIMAIEWEEAVRPIVEGAGLLPRPVLNGD